MAIIFITTADNPYDPATDYKNWHNYDMQKGYYTAEYLDRIYEKNLSMKGVKLDDSEIDDEILESSIDEIIELNDKFSIPLNNKDSSAKIQYVKVVVKES